MHVQFPWAFVVDVGYLFTLAKVVLQGVILCLPLMITLFCLPVCVFFSYGWKIQPSTTSDSFALREKGSL